MRASDASGWIGGMRGTAVVGMSLATFTLLHVLISLIGIAAGLMTVIGWLRSRASSRAWTTLFLGATFLTSATGFLFPFTTLQPAHIVGSISLLTLAVAAFALYGRQLSGRWRLVYVIAAMLSLYLNVFVLIVQSFLKVAPLKALAPTGTEPAFLIVQGAALLFFAAFTILAAIRVRPAKIAAA
jgi:hypothetical protein